MTQFFKNIKKALSLTLTLAIIAVSLFTGVVANAADPVETAHGTVDLLEFGDYLLELGSTNKYYDNKLDDNGETGADWDNAIIIDSAEELVYLCKASGDDTIGKYYRVADGIAGFNLSSANLDLNGTLADNIDIIKNTGKNHSGGTPGFQGHFDGNGATVYGAWTNHNEGQVANYAGLFSCTKGDVTIKNINVKLASFTAKNAAGGIVGYHVGDGTQTLAIENCSVTDSHIEYVGTGNFGHGIGAILGYSANLSSWKEADKGVDGNGDGDMVDTIYENGAVNIKNCYVNLDEDYFISCLKPGDANVRGCHGGIAGFINTNAMFVSDCIVIGITPYATSSSIDYNDVQHSGLESHFANVYTTDDVAITEVNLGGSGALASRNFTGKIFPLTDAQLKGAAAVDNMDLDWSVWMADSEGYPKLRNIHKSVGVVDNGNGTHSEACECGFGGIAVEHTYIDGVCACGAELNCATRQIIYWDGTVANGIATGTGTKADPYIIKTAAELAYLVKNADEDSTAATAHKSAGKYYKIDDAIGAIVLQPKEKAEAIMALADSADVKAYFDNESGLVEWVEAGWEQSSFCGDFDGNGVTIYGLYSISESNAGLFSTVDAGAAFHNIALKNSYLTTTGTNYQVGGIAATTSGYNYGRKAAGAIWFDGCVVANNYMYNPCDSHDRSGVIFGASQDLVYMDNCLVYGNDATYGTAGVTMPIVSCSNNSTIVSDSVVAPDGLELENDGAETPRYYNMVRNSIIFGAHPYDLAQPSGSRFNDPNCYRNVLTDAASGKVQFANYEGKERFAIFSDKQLKTVAVADLKTAELSDAWLNTDTYPELRAFHDEVFGNGVANGATGHSLVCSCGVSYIAPHNFATDVETPEWDSYYCSVCSYVCEHVSEEEGLTVYEGDCVTAAGYEYDCSLCGYHEEYFDEIAGHDFTAHEAVKGADCLTAGNIAYKYCYVCGKNYTADASDVEPFENALYSIKGEKGDHEVLMESDVIFYGKDSTNHWTICATCGDPLETIAHTLTVAQNGAQGHLALCEICGYEADNVPHTFGDDNVCDVEGCEWVCTEHSYVDGEVKTLGDCTTDKVIEQVCEICGIAGEDRVIVAAGHSAAESVKENFILADCVTDGSHDEVVYCEVCNKELSRTTVLDLKIGHDFVNVEAIAATCIKNGQKTHKRCTVCYERFEFEESDVYSKNYLENFDIIIVDNDAHFYDNNCDTNCNLCDHIREINHSYFSSYVADNESHWKQCAVCGNQKDVSDHVYDNGCDTTCDVCGYERETTHDYKTEWDYNDTHHWHQCSVCADKTDDAEHVFDNANDIECNICHATFEVPVNITSIKILQKPTKLEYFLDEELDLTGIKVELAYDDGSTEIITTEFTISGFDSSTVGNKIITVEYSGFSATFIVNVIKCVIDEDDPQIVIESKKITRGNQFTVDVSIKNNPGFIYLEVTPVYSSELTLVSIQNGDLISDFTQGKQYVWVANEDVSEDGTLLTMTFNVDETVEVGNYQIGFNIRTCANYDEEPVEIFVVNSDVEVIDYIYGDATGDGVVDGFDVIRLKKYLANFDYDTQTSTIEIFNGADANGDEKIDGFDVVRLKKYLANYDYDTGESTVVLGPQ